MAHLLCSFFFCSGRRSRVPLLLHRWLGSIDPRLLLHNWWRSHRYASRLLLNWNSNDWWIPKAPIWNILQYCCTMHYSQLLSKLSTMLFKLTQICNSIITLVPPSHTLPILIAQYHLCEIFPNHHDQIHHSSPKFVIDPLDLTVGFTINKRLIHRCHHLTGLTAVLTAWFDPIASLWASPHCDLNNFSYAATRFQCTNLFNTTLCILFLHCAMPQASRHTERSW